MEYYSNFSFPIEDVTIGVAMVSYRRFRHIMPMHCHGENIYEIHYVSEGKGRVLIDSTEYEIGEGTLYVTGPNVFHEQIPDVENPVTEFGIYLRTNKVRPAGSVMKVFCEQSAWIGAGSDELKNLMNQIVYEHEKKHFGWREKSTLLLSEFVIECARSYQSLSSERKKLPRPKEVFLSHKIQKENTQLVMDEMFLYEYKDVTLETMAERLGLSVRQTQRFVSKAYGKSFMQKKREARMHAAVTMLTHTRMTITKISENLGYSSLEHFSNAFSKYYGKSPREYRK